MAKKKPHISYIVSLCGIMCAVSLVMMFYLTCIVSRENERSRAMTQQLALLEKRIRELEEKQ